MFRGTIIVRILFQPDLSIIKKKDKNEGEKHKEKITKKDRTMREEKKRNLSSISLCALGSRHLVQHRLDSLRNHALDATQQVQPLQGLLSQALLHKLLYKLVLP